jgi:hypothetical protein
MMNLLIKGTLVLVLLFGLGFTSFATAKIPSKRNYGTTVEGVGVFNVGNSYQKYIKETIGSEAGNARRNRVCTLVNFTVKSIDNTNKKLFVKNSSLNEIKFQTFCKKK